MMHAWKIGGFTMALALGVACASEPLDESDADPGSDEAKSGAATADVLKLRLTPAEGEPDAALLTEPGNGPRATQPLALLEDELDDGAGGGEEPSLEGNNKCNLTCTVTKSIEAAYCPDSVSGYGESGWFRGCRTACRRARDDAQSHLGVGCNVGQCAESC
ncbi:hypothetical protein [Chondromyces crocatus]|uniref:Secreted protein n=1 Tax=Chondromyces crocatus TaxID=52 RepID=A0A0K1EMN0_CHOCO|nr:hypothetical protein [Chondromyces crocatus]AKT42061.1 uncharacterized protein CMC5_062840 [Chondromyces crocatus]